MEFFQNNVKKNSFFYNSDTSYCYDGCGVKKYEKDINDFMFYIVMRVSAK